MSIIDELLNFIQQHPRLLVITGAGCSQPSGIPTYRDEEGVWQRSTPIQHKEFMEIESVRKRYWARSYSGWPSIRGATPNNAHHSLKSLEALGYIQQLVTQNVDGLHQAAGHKSAVDLHGRLSEVVCTQCGKLSARERLQRRFTDLNSNLSADYETLQPDGDASLDHNVETEITSSLIIPACETCNGMLKPNVVFFGGTVPRETVESIYSAMEDIDGLLVVGSSMMVFSGYRFCKRASALEIPIASINNGKTRADDLLSLKVSDDCVSVLTQTVSALSQ
ncbi:NAD-dependent protein deacetylase [Pseudomonadales bacterium]|nr:NAD-dependent protein deacetylase [Pseudomonadales bacterium]